MRLDHPIRRRYDRPEGGDATRAWRDRRNGFARDIEAGGIALGDDSFPERFHRALTPALEAERDAATIDPALRPGNKLSRNARQATRVLPATWIDRANDTPVQVVKRSKNSPFLGRYEQADP